MGDLCEIPQSSFPISDSSDSSSFAFGFSEFVFDLSASSALFYWSRALCRPRQVSPQFPIGRSLVSISKPVSLVYIYNLCIFSSKIRKYEVDIPKATLIFLPIVFSQVKRLDASLLLESRFFKVNPQLPRQFPQEDWNQLFSSSYKACKLAIGAKVDDSEPTIPEFSTEIGLTLHTMSRRLKGLFKSSKS